MNGFTARLIALDACIAAIAISVLVTSGVLAYDPNAFWHGVTITATSISVVNVIVIIGIMVRG